MTRAWPLYVLLALVLTVGVGVGFSLITAGRQVTAFRRDFVVEASRTAAWRHFAQAKAWPSWATYIRQVDVEPDGELTARSVATLRLHSGPDTTFRMSEFEPEQHWMWSSRALWFTLNYDHAFESLSDRQTRMTLHMRVSGFGNWLFAPVIAAASRKNLDAAIPKLQDEMRTLR